MRNTQLSQHITLTRCRLFHHHCRTSVVQQQAKSPGKGIRPCNCGLFQWFECISRDSLSPWFRGPLQLPIGGYDVEPAFQELLGSRFQLVPSLASPWCIHQFWRWWFGWHWLGRVGFFFCKFVNQKMETALVNHVEKVDYKRNTQNQRQFVVIVQIVEIIIYCKNLLDDIYPHRINSSSAGVDALIWKNVSKEPGDRPFNNRPDPHILLKIYIRVYKSNINESGISSRVNYQEINCNEWHTWQWQSHGSLFEDTVKSR